MYYVVKTLKEGNTPRPQPMQPLKEIINAKGKKIA
jgi:hypothetical protein